MRPDTLQFVLSGAERLLAPAYWLVAGLDWPTGPGPSEAAWAIAPDLVPRDALSNDAYQVLGKCSPVRGQALRPHRVLSDLTRMFATAGTSWASLGVDWQAALDELQNGPFPAMFLTISERAHLMICDPASWSTGCAQEPARSERELVRQAVSDKLTADLSATWAASSNRASSRHAGQRRLAEHGPQFVDRPSMTGRGRPEQHRLAEGHRPQTGERRSRKILDLR